MSSPTCRLFEWHLEEKSLADSNDSEISPRSYAFGAPSRSRIPTKKQSTVQSELGLETARVRNLVVERNRAESVPSAALPGERASAPYIVLHTPGFYINSTEEHSAQDVMQPREVCLSPKPTSAIRDRLRPRLLGSVHSRGMGRVTHPRPASTDASPWLQIGGGSEWSCAALCAGVSASPRAAIPSLLPRCPCIRGARRILPNVHFFSMSA